METYLTISRVKKFRTAMSRFRCSSHDLFIESGRYRNIEREKRICKLCPLGLIEDEYHFVLVCPEYSSLRGKYILPYYYNYPNTIKFSVLLSNTNENTCNSLSLFIYHALKHRLKRLTDIE